jgi:energy-coupling factor transporter transmembrane protein EcfT
LLHPATKIILWLALLVASQKMAPAALILTLTVLIFALCRRGMRSFLRLFWRMRYVFLLLLLVYGYATPGSALVTALQDWSPTREGLRQAGEQILRLAVAFAGLSVLLSAIPGKEMIAGLFTVLGPLRLLRVDVERLTVRFALTLDYARSARERTFRQLLDDLRAPPAQAEVIDSIVLPSFAMSWRDILVLSLAFAGVLVVFQW